MMFLSPPSPLDVYAFLIKQRIWTRGSEKTKFGHHQACVLICLALTDCPSPEPPCVLKCYNNIFKSRAHVLSLYYKHSYFSHWK